MKIIKKPESLFVTKYSNSLSFADATISVNDNKMPDDNTESEQRIPKQKINSPAKCVFFFIIINKRQQTAHRARTHGHAAFIPNSFESQYELQRIRDVAERLNVWSIMHTVDGVRQTPHAH